MPRAKESAALRLVTQKIKQRLLGVDYLKPQVRYRSTVGAVSALGSALWASCYAATPTRRRQVCSCRYEDHESAIQSGQNVDVCSCGELVELVDTQP